MFLPPRDLYQGTWHSKRMMSSNANDMWVCTCLSAWIWHDTLACPAGPSIWDSMLAPPAVHCCSADGPGPGLITGKWPKSQSKSTKCTRWTRCIIISTIFYLKLFIYKSHQQQQVLSVHRFKEVHPDFYFYYYLLYFEIKARIDFRAGTTYFPPTWHSSWQTTRRTSSPCPVCADSVP